MKRVLIIDDDPDHHKLLGLFLKTRNYQCSYLLEGSETLKVIRDFQPDIIILDIMMPGLTGRTIYDGIRDEFGYCMPIIVCSGLKMSFKRIKDNLIDYCPKPVDLDVLEKKLNKLMEASEKCRNKPVEKEVDSGKKR